ncbi:MAG: BLUF domain-containing protein [Rhodothalassiaceae bacterium]
MRDVTSTPVLERLAYCSRATQALDQEELTELLDRARAHNHVNDVTGILVYCHDHFLQILEGAPEAVAKTLERIRRDQRHTDLQVLQIEHTTARRFDQWHMGYCPTACRPPLQQRLKALFASPPNSRDIAQVEPMLRTFYDAAQLDGRLQGDNWFRPLLPPRQAS